ncbi:MAG: S-adenosyl-l-methionine hydroxide adenosyltransferase family protein [Phycisphaerae bacterium]
MPIIALTTDFGGVDYYVGALKGVILSIAPKAAVVDVTHDVPPQDVVHGAFVLRQVWRWYPRGTIHVAVVDPGVGGDRRILLAGYEGRYVIAPDNGLITWLHRGMKSDGVRVVENARYFLPQVSATFHGRDIMAPVAAHLANGVKAQSFGRATDRVAVVPLPRRAERTAGGIVGVVVYVDRFGTLVSNITRADVAAGAVRGRGWDVAVNGTDIGPLRDTFTDVRAGTPVAFIGSGDLLEIAVNHGSAIDRFGPAADVRVVLRPAGVEAARAP